MITIKEMARQTPKGNVRRSRRVIIQLKYAVKTKDKFGDCYLFHGVARDSMNKLHTKHLFWIKRYGTGPNSKCRLLCSCANFTYVWEMALARKQSAVRFKSNGMRPVITNPLMRPGVCKHLVQAIRMVAKLTPTKELKTIVRLPKNF
jgi:hypothetical protein